MGPNWVRREAPEVDVLATDPIEHHAILSSPMPTSGPRTGRLALASRLPAPSAEDSLPVIPENDEELARLPAGHRAFLKQVSEEIRKSETSGKPPAKIQPKPAPSSLEPFRPSDYQAPLVLEDDSGDADEEQSTNLFESFEEEGTPVGADMLSVDQHATESIKTGKRKHPHLTVVRSVSDSIEGEYAGVRASPPVADPRPVPDEVVDWPPPMERPGIDYPEDWWTDTVGGTMIVIDPVRTNGLAGGLLGRSGRLGVMMIDAGAWLLGFVTMFITGLVTTGSALLVLFALSLE
jgi:hypothetical protein